MDAIDKVLLTKTYNILTLENYKMNSIEKLCKKIGISKKTFYATFTSKEKFVSELMNHFNTEIEIELEKINQNNTTITMKILEVYQNLIAAYFRFNTINKFYNKQSDIIKKHELNFKATFINGFTTLLNEINDNNEIDKNLNHYMLSKVIVNMAILYLEKKELIENDKIENSLLKYLLINTLKGMFISSCEDLKNLQIEAAFLEKSFGN